MAPLEEEDDDDAPEVGPVVVESRAPLREEDGDEEASVKAPPEAKAGSPAVEVTKDEVEDLDDASPELASYKALDLDDASTSSENMDSDDDFESTESKLDTNLVEELHVNTVGSNLGRIAR